MKCPACGYYAFNGIECFDCGYKARSKMKSKIGLTVLVGLFLSCATVFLLSASCGLEVSDSTVARREANAASTRAQVAAQASVVIPDLTYFQERRTIAKWAEHWDKPSAACYIYLISYGNIIGYYVSDGKPASTYSYLTPEYLEESRGGNGIYNVQLPDIDGCYGSNNPGIRFFTASGIAVEWGGATASYLYSDVPLNINVPLLGN